MVGWTRTCPIRDATRLSSRSIVLHASLPTHYPMICSVLPSMPLCSASLRGGGGCSVQRKGDVLCGGVSYGMHTDCRCVRIAFVSERPSASSAVNIFIKVVISYGKEALGWPLFFLQISVEEKRLIAANC